MAEQENTLSYSEYIKPLITGIRDSINETLEGSEKEYSEFDVYNALALSITLVASRNLGEDNRAKANDESNKISKAMLETGLEAGQKDQVFMASLILGAARTVTSMSEIVEGLQKEEKQEVAVAEEEKPKAKTKAKKK